MTQQHDTKPGPEPLSEQLAGLAAFFEAYERDGVILEPTLDVDGVRKIDNGRFLVPIEG